MKLVSHFMNQIENVEIFPIISMFIFLTIFVLVVYRAFSVDKKFVEDAANLPLDDDSDFNKTD